MLEQPRVFVCPEVATSVIGSFLDGPRHAVIVLRGDIDAAVVDRLAVHIEDFLATRTRVLAIDATEIERSDPSLLDLLGHTQRRLGHRRGLLRVLGLHPNLLPDPRPASEPAPEPVTALLRSVISTPAPATVLETA